MFRKVWIWDLLDIRASEGSERGQIRYPKGPKPWIWPDLARFRGTRVPALNTYTLNGPFLDPLLDLFTPHDVGVG